MKYFWLAVSALRHTRLAERSALLILVLIAFALRVYRLDAQAIWWDESLTVYRATRDLAAVFSNVILIQNVVTIDTLPQLYFVLQHLMVRALGTREYALRFLSVAANVATIPLLYALTRRWLMVAAAQGERENGKGAEGRRHSVPLLTALLAVLSPFYVYYAQEARPYTLVLFLSLLAVYALTRAFARVESDGSSVAPRWIAVYLFTAAASLYTHYYTVFLLPFHAVLVAVLVWPPRRFRTLAWLLLPVVPLASAILLLPQVIASLAGNVGSGPTFVPLDVILRDLLNSFSVGVTIDMAEVVWIDVALLVLFVTGVAAMRSWRAAIFPVAYLAVPIAGVFLASFIRPLYQNSRYFIALSPAFYVGLAAGSAILARRWQILALAGLAIFLLGAVFSLTHLYFDARFGRDDHRAWAEYLRERVRPGDFLILDSPHTEELYHYYADDWLPWGSLPVLRANAPDADGAAVRYAYRRHARVWFLEMHVPFDDPQKRIESIMNREGVLIDRVNFAGTSTELALSLFVPSLPVASTGDIAHPLNAAFGSHLRLLGYDAPATIESGARGVVKLYWQIDQPVGEDYSVSLRVVDLAGDVWGQWDAVPLGNRAGSSTWSPGTIMIDAHDLPIAVGTQPGAYRLQVQAYHATTTAALGDAQTLDEIRVTRPRVPIDPGAVSVAHRSGQVLGALRVIGGDWRAAPARPGSPVQVAVYFQVLEKPVDDVPLVLQLVQRAFPFMGTAPRAQASVVLSARDLEAGDIVRRNLALRVPVDAAGDYELHIALSNGNGVNLGRVSVESIARVTDAPTIAFPQAARVGDVIAFLGYDLNASRVRRGDAVHLTLYWRAEKMMGTSYTVFTHVIDANNQIFGQQDRVPVAGTRPTTGWVPGEVIADPYAVELEDTPPGKYRVEIGLYDAANGARLPTFDANGAPLGDRILLSQEIDVP